MSKDSFFKDDNSASMGLLALLNNEIETNEYAHIGQGSVSKKDPKWWIAIVLSFSGLFFGLAVSNTQQQQPIIEKNREDLRNTITKNIENLNIASKNLSLINDEIAQIQSNTPGLNFHGISESSEQNLQIFSGLSSVKGKGLEITISDAPKTDSLESEDIGLAKVYDTDLQLLVNALWASGAESISINDRRLTTTSAIRSAGEAILVNYRPLLQPFIIAAIGDEKLKERLMKNPDFADLEFVVKTYGLGFNVSELKDIEMSATGVALPTLEGITVGDRS
ncbi:MAG: hypothetical protein RIS18_855 [Actinomycetota bacterium]|jgi:uncharacterized protein YlxW (UPF0749 family)